MKPSNPPEDVNRDTWIHYLLDLDITNALPPDQRLLLAILRQSVVDYFGDDPVEQLSAALYFARSPIYRTTLQLFDLPEDTLPLGVDLSEFRRKESMNKDYQPDALQLETLVRKLPGTHLKIVLTMGLLPMPVVTRKISLRCGLTRGTVLTALDSLADQGLVVRDELDGRRAWSFPATVRRIIAAVWGGQEN